MNELKILLDRFHDQITEQLQGPGDAKRQADLGMQIREQVVRLLRRTDLRIGAEILLHDLRNAFSGFETFDLANRRQTMEEALHIIENLDALTVADQVLNPDRITLPPAPPVTSAMVQEKEKAIVREARAQIERIRAERNKLRTPSRRPLPRHSKPPVDEREKAKPDRLRQDLIFSASGEKTADLASSQVSARGPKPAEIRKPTPAAPEAASGQKNASQPDRHKFHRGRRRGRRSRK